MLPPAPSRASATTPTAVQDDNLRVDQDVAAAMRAPRGGRGCDFAVDELDQPPGGDDDIARSRAAVERAVIDPPVLRKVSVARMVTLPASPLPSLNEAMEPPSTKVTTEAVTVTDPGIARPQGGGADRAPLAELDLVRHNRHPPGVAGRGNPLARELDDLGGVAEDAGPGEHRFGLRARPIHEQALGRSP